LAATPTPPFPASAVGGDAWDYLVDRWQRSILTLDVLRERGNVYLEHAESGKPPVLVFDHEVIVDGRTLEHPANYALARIVPPQGFPSIDDGKRPFVVIDPRAGHGPGIGGFKMDSEIGIALRNGHPCYFVMFYPDPVPGQTIESVARAEVAFLRRVNELHPHAEGKPFVIGNCQGGWALVLLAASAPELVGPILLAGSPISYWAGVRGTNPMRYSGGLLGGTWLASLAGDLGHGKFDGSALVTNFEQLDPANTYWSKMYNLFDKVDTERERYLEFERWWGGHFLLNKEEMEWIAQNLFVGNRLSAGEVTTADGRHRIDMRRIRSPIVVFASWGDNITPPQQALNWVLDLYDSVDEIRANEQTIVYCLHEKIGHLGIFVSGGVASKEHAELASALNLIDVLPPGLYEAVIEDTHPDMPGLEWVQGRYVIHFEPRALADIEALDDGRDDERPFEVVARLAQANQTMYDAFVSPWLKLMVTEPMAQAMRAMAPPRLERALLSDRNPWLWPLQWLAPMVKGERRTVAADNPFVVAEHGLSDAIVRAWNQWRDMRDASQEAMFFAIFDSPWMRQMLGMQADGASGKRARVRSFAEDELARLRRQQAESWFDEGPLLGGVLRLLLHVGEGTYVADERLAKRVGAMLEGKAESRAAMLTTLREQMRRQAYVLMLDRERAVAALPRLLPEPAQRERALEIVRDLLATTGRANPTTQARFDAVVRDFGLDRRTLSIEVATASLPAAARRRAPAKAPAAAPARKRPNPRKEAA
jgi:pimeloyl-ACP methyl ester carboxylesterase